MLDPDDKSCADDRNFVSGRDGFVARASEWFTALERVNDFDTANNPAQCRMILSSSARPSVNAAGPGCKIKDDLIS
jgi:hypothetical protein